MPAGGGPQSVVEPWRSGPRGRSSRSRPRPAQVDLLPGALAHVVDEEAGAGGVGVEGEAEGVAQAPGEGLLADLAGGGAPGVAAAVPAPGEGVAGRDRRRRGDAQDLADSTLRSRAASLAPAQPLVAGVVAAAVADADVESPSLPKLQVAAVVVAGRRRACCRAAPPRRRGCCRESMKRETRLTGGATVGGLLKVEEEDEAVVAKAGSTASRGDPARSWKAQAVACERRAGTPGGGGRPRLPHQRLRLPLLLVRQGRRLWHRHRQPGIQVRDDRQIPWAARWSSSTTSRPRPATTTAATCTSGKDGLLYVSVGDGGCDYLGLPLTSCGGANNACA